LNIHPLAVVHPTAVIGKDVEIGAFAVIEPRVTIGDRTTIGSFAVIKEGTGLGTDNRIFERATIGGLPQHVHMPVQVGTLSIGNHNTLREGTTIHRALHMGQRPIDPAFFRSVVAGVLKSLQPLLR
jgi:UDP-N-acetylglucosamine acyltransferase